MKINQKGFAPLAVLLIVLGVLAVGGVVYFTGKSSTPKNTVSDNYFPTTGQNYTPPTTNNNNTSSQTPLPTNNPPQQTLQYKYNNKIISYDSNLWKLVEKRYCTPAQGEGDKKYDGTPCDLVGFDFIFKNTVDGFDSIYMGGRQPMGCDVIMNATKCDDRLALVTSSNKKVVLDFYDYLLKLLQ